MTSDMLPIFIIGLILTMQAPHSTDRTGVKSADRSEHLSGWEAELDARYRALEAKNGAGKDKVLREKLIRMGMEDQRVRTWMMNLPQSQWTPAMGKEQAKTDMRLTAELKRIVQMQGWPTIALVGVRASNNAMMILTHSPDHNWQKSMIPKLETLVQRDEITGPDLATLIDKELVAGGHKQLFGTQFAFRNGKMMMYKAGSLATLDARRAKWLLPPESVYKQEMAQAYSGLKMTDQIVAPPAPSNPLRK